MMCLVRYVWVVGISRPVDIALLRRSKTRRVGIVLVVRYRPSAAPTLDKGPGEKRMGGRVAGLWSTRMFL